MAFFRCPDCCTPLGDPCPESCPRCGRLLMRGGVLDFVAQTTGEREYYDDEYKRTTVIPADLAAAWRSTYFPMNGTVLAAVGDVKGRDVLLVGNGSSVKELHFSELGARRLVFSDYSAAAMRSVQAGVRSAQRAFEGDVHYAAIDANALPFVDGALDVVYGYAFVHHLPDPRPFLREAHRVLRPGGRAVFMDNPRSPLYQRAKLGILRPLMTYYHRRGGISPEDRQATLSGWYSVDELRAMLSDPGIEPFFHRSLLVHYLVGRASERLPPQAVFRRYQESEAAQRALIRLDRWLERFAVVRQNQMRLVWGFVKR